MKHSNAAVQMKPTEKVFHPILELQQKKQKQKQRTKNKKTYVRELNTILLRSSYFIPGQRFAFLRR